MKFRVKRLVSLAIVFVLALSVLGAGKLGIFSDLNSVFALAAGEGGASEPAVSEGGASGVAASEGGVSGSGAGEGGASGSAAGEGGASGSAAGEGGASGSAAGEEGDPGATSVVPTVSPTPAVAPTERPAAAPTETPAAAPTERPAAAPTETPDAAVPTETPDAAVPTETPDAAAPTETPDVEEPDPTEEPEPTDTPSASTATPDPIDEPDPTEEPDPTDDPSDPTSTPIGPTMLPETGALELREDAVLELSEAHILTGLIQEQNKVQDILQQFVTEDIIIKDRTGKTLTSKNYVGTGAEIAAMDGDDVVDFCHAVLIGDINGDGKVNVKDVSMLARSLVKKETLDEFQSAAGEIREDGAVNVKDVSMLAQSLVGKSTISSQAR